MVTTPHSMFVVLQLLSLWITSECQSEDLSIKISYRLDIAKTLTLDNAGNSTLLLSLQAAEASRRLPVGLVVVLDTSTSVFFDQQLESMINTTNYFLDNLDNNDYFGLIAFNLQAEVRIPFQKFDRSSIPQYKQLLQQFEAQGPSSLIDGVRQGLQIQLDTQLPQDMIRGVIFISDGLANVGVTQVESMTQLVEQKTALSEEVLRLFTIATSGVSNLPLMEELALSGDGAFLFFSNPSDVIKAFGLNFGGLISTYYQDVVLTIEAKQDVRIYGLKTGERIILENDTLAQAIFTDLRADEIRDVLVQFGSNSDFIPPSQTLLTVSIQYFSTIEQRLVNGDFDITIGEIGGEADAFIEIDNLRFLVSDILAQAKTIQNDQGATQRVLNEVEKALNTINELKSGGILQRLNLTSKVSQAVEIRPKGSRRSLLANDDWYLQKLIARYRQLFNILELILEDSRRILQNLGNRQEEQLRLIYILLGLSKTLKMQRLEVLASDEFASTIAVRDFYITPTQLAFQQGQDPFEQMVERIALSTSASSASLSSSGTVPLTQPSIFDLVVRSLIDDDD
eukprot:TRINITY_DN61554_c0_g1_i1.p1 TRINITY_DN61554_c0_g1~~TRINITY_DN61554_c0_g1_i1.p1  ORF type:complete len:587 (-),score=47.27 TRINITY_DN61554_c0_g1_i1:110-1810(-)